MPYLIVGLGNPGPQYDQTRHNVGFMVVDALARRIRVADWRRGFASLWLEADWRGERLTLLKPQTYMNRSGEAVAQAVRALRMQPGQLLVIYDDLDLPLGHLRLRPRGGSGGHRGMLSVIEHLGTEDFPRLRIGIGRPPAGVDPADYVLAPFADAERSVVERAVQRAVEACLAVVAAGLQLAMSRYNGPPPGDPADGAGPAPGGEPGAGPRETGGEAVPPRG
ncbi:MAG: aminoacyl-tRNA hydrolase [Symbiobacteriaceae bacterium]|nr:MAG: aminoacyl-tRNA hydrolase [Bacillota bacterium]